MFWSKGRRLAYNSTSLLSLLIIFPNFLHNTSYVTLDYPILQLQASFDVCAHIPLTLWVSIFLHYVHGNEHIRTHDAIHNTFATIAQDASFHMGRKQLHAFLSTTFNFSSRRVDIVLTKNDIHTLANVVITDPT
jgi:hypothetical protein